MLRNPICSSITAIALVGASVAGGCSIAQTAVRWEDYVPGEGNSRIILRPVPPAPPRIRKRAFRQMDAITSESGTAKVVREMALDVLKTGDPYLVAEMMTRLWARQGFGDGAAQVFGVIEQALVYPDPLVRWSAISAAHFWQEGEIVCEALKNDHRFLLICPVPPAPDAMKFPGRLGELERDMYRCGAASRMQGERTFLIELLGEYKVIEGIPTLEALAAGRGEYDPTATECAKEALKRILEGKTVTPGRAAVPCVLRLLEGKSCRSGPKDPTIW